VGRRIFQALGFAAFAVFLGIDLPALPAPQRHLALLDFASGAVGITRAGSPLPAVAPGDAVFDGDFIRTGADGHAVLALDPSSGFSGTLTVNPGSTVYVTRGLVKGQPRTGVDLMTGSVSTKLAKLAGTPGMTVSTGEAAFAVRGTEFEIAVSVNASLLAICLEGMISVSADKTQKNLGAGIAIAKKTDAVFARLPVPETDLRQYRETWIKEEIAAFNADPLKAITSYEGRYRENARDLVAGADRLAQSPILQRWISQEVSGSIPAPLDPQVMAEKKDIIPLIFAVARRMAIFERIYWRLDEVAGLVRGTRFEKELIRKDYTVAAFLRDLDTDRAAINAAIAVYRQAEDLYKNRNPDSAGLPSAADENDPFSTGDPFFDQGDSGS
jgi:hypothetical protein